MSSTSYSLNNIVSASSVYSGYKMLAYLFRVVPWANLISVNGIPIANIPDALSTHYSYTITNSLPVPVLNMTNLYNSVNGVDTTYRTYWIGHFLITYLSTPYHYYFLMCMVNGGVYTPAGPGSSPYGLGTYATLVFNDTGLTSGQPNIPQNRLFALPTNTNCPNSESVRDYIQPVIT